MYEMLYNVVCSDLAGHTGMVMATGTGVCCEYMFMGTGMKTGTGTGTITTFTFSSPCEEVNESIDRPGVEEERKV